jgi:hypothetical protein
MSVATLRRAALLLLLAALVLPRSAAAQDAPRVALERFMQQVARLWAEGNADALAELAPKSGRLMLDLGAEAGGAVQGRHANAALRSLFSARETASLRASRITVSGARHGFGEFHWAYRSRAMSSQQTASVYFGVVWEENAWRIREIRVFS